MKDVDRANWLGRKVPLTEAQWIRIDFLCPMGLATLGSGSVSHGNSGFREKIYFKTIDLRSALS